MGNSLDLGETLATLDRELHRLVRYDAMSVHLIEDCRITPAYAAGADFQILAALEARAGSGLLGGVAATRQPAFNCVPDGSGRLKMAMAVPLEPPVECWDRATAVLALYRLEPDPFAPDDLRILTMLSLKLAAPIDNARRFERVERACARALFERLDAEVARARRARGRLALLDCAVVALDPAGPVAE